MMSKYSSSGGARPKTNNKKGCSSVPSSNRGSFDACPQFIPPHMKGQLTRDILSADFDALFAWAKERESYPRHYDGGQYQSRLDEQNQQPHRNSNPTFAINDERVRGDVYLKECGSYGDIDSSERVSDDNGMLTVRSGLHRPHSVIGTLTTTDESEEISDHNDRSRGVFTRSDQNIDYSSDLDRFDVNNDDNDDTGCPVQTPQSVQSNKKGYRLTILSKKKKYQPPSPSTFRSYKITPKGLVKDKERKSPLFSRASKNKTSSSGSKKKTTQEKRELKVALMGEYGVGKRELVREFLMPDDTLYGSIDCGKWS